ncbi:Clp protease ClpP [Lacticaseibacillus nasuensis]|nr:head maturation protease, ClpP-related [Lacticaseibacillus nasuensis]MCX2455629.1 Clp protease ClpP [Lacticaseibacillus nasuensis]
MMTLVQIKGDVVDDETASFYAFFGIQAVSPKLVSDAIASDQDGELTLQIASNGGDVFAASEIYTMLKQYDGKVNVEVQGLAASAASVIAAAGDTVKMSPTAQIMIHRAWSVVQGNTEDAAHESEVLDKIDHSIAAAYEARTGMTEGELLDLMTKETWMGAQEAVDKGFADEIMFVDDKQPQVAASAGVVVPKSAVNKLLNLISKAERKSRPEPSEHEQQSLRQRKLAILMSEKED